MVIKYDIMVRSYIVWIIFRRGGFIFCMTGCVAYVMGNCVSSIMISIYMDEYQIIYLYISDMSDMSESYTSIFNCPS